MNGFVEEPLVLQGLNLIFPMAERREKLFCVGKSETRGSEGKDWVVSGNLS